MGEFNIKMDISSDEGESEKTHIDKYVFVDVVGFNNRHRFICKEFFLIDGDYRYHAIIKPTYDMYKMPIHDRQMIIWEINHLHGLTYGSEKKKL